MADHFCMRCGAKLQGDEIALFRKMVFRGATEFLCLDCLASDLSSTRGELETLIRWFYRTGVCTLFVKPEPNGREASSIIGETLGKADTGKPAAEWS